MSGSENQVEKVIARATIKAWERMEEKRLLEQMKVGRVANNDSKITIVPKNDPISHPAHYCLENGAELIDVIDALPYCRAAAIKYIFRAGVKDKDTLFDDLRKAIWMIRHEMERLGWKHGSSS